MTFTAAGICLYVLFVGVLFPLACWFCGSHLFDNPLGTTVAVAEAQQDLDKLTQGLPVRRCSWCWSSTGYHTLEKEPVRLRCSDTTQPTQVQSVRPQRWTVLLRSWRPKKGRLNCPSSNTIVVARLGPGQVHKNARTKKGHMKEKRL